VGPYGRQRQLPTVLSLLALVVVALLSPHAHAQGPQAAPVGSPVRRAKLDNGLRIVIQRQAEAPTTVVALSYLAGSAHDPPHRTGTAQLLEQAMFMGSPGGAPLKRGDHRRMLESVGGSASVLRSADVTSYVNRVPAARVPLALWLEAARMLAIHCDPPQLDRARKRLLAAAREREGRDPAAMARARLRFVALQAHPSYGRPDLGGIDAVVCSDVVAAHRAQHGPARAVLTVIGNIDADALLEQVLRYFGPIPQRPSGDGWRPNMREQTTRRAASFRSPAGHRNVLAYGWAVAGQTDAERATLEVTAALLGGRASTLRRQLVLEDAKALEVSTHFAGLRGPDVLGVVVELSREQAPTDAVARVEHAALRLVNVGPGEEDVVGVRRQLATQLLAELQSHAVRAHRLGQYELLAGDAQALFRRVGAYRSVTRDSVRRMARRYLLPHRSTAIEGFAAVIPRPLGSKDDKAKKKKKKRKRKRKQTRKPKRKRKTKAKPKRKRKKQKRKAKPKKRKRSKGKKGKR